MYRTIIIFVMALLANNGIYANEVEMDSDLMQMIEDTNKSLASNIALQDAKASIVDAKELEKMFANVETFFVNKGNADDAVQLSKKIRVLTIEIEKSVETKNFDAARDTATTLSRTCKTCHNFYKKS